MSETVLCPACRRGVPIPNPLPADARTCSRCGIRLDAFVSGPARTPGEPSEPTAVFYDLDPRPDLLYRLWPMYLAWGLVAVVGLGNLVLAAVPKASLRPWDGADLLIFSILGLVLLFLTACITSGVVLARKPEDVGASVALSLIVGVSMLFCLGAGVGLILCVVLP
jgi:hypothetical protein